MTNTSGKTVLITGGGSGIGLATAKTLLEEGGRVVLAGRSSERLSRAAKELDAGADVVTVTCDISVDSDLDALVERIGETVGSLDGVFANAGVALNGRTGDITRAGFDSTIGTNLAGTFFTVQKTLPVLRDGSSIVLNGSWLVHNGMGPGSVYAASKAAVTNLARSLASDVADRGIRVNTVTPGHIETEMFDQVAPNEQVRDFFRSQVVLRRLGKPEDVANVVAFLLSDKSSYVNGHELVVDGGLTTSVAL